MSVTYNKLGKRISKRLNLLEEDAEKELPRITEILRVAFVEIGSALANGEDVYLEGFGRFYPDFKPPRKIHSGITNKEYMTKRKIFVRFNAFKGLNSKVQKYLKQLGFSTEGE